VPLGTLVCRCIPVWNHWSTASQIDSSPNQTTISKFSLSKSVKRSVANFKLHSENVVAHITEFDSTCIRIYLFFLAICLMNIDNIESQVKRDTEKKSNQGNAR